MGISVHSLFIMNRILHRTKVIRQCSYRYVSDHSVIYHPPSLKNIPTRWSSLSIPLREEIQEYLDWQMTGDWRDMTTDEKQSIYYISYGAWGPRAKHTPNKEKTSTNQVNNIHNKQISIPYLVIRGLFNLVLFSAVGVSILNLKKDKQVEFNEQTIVA